MIDKDWNIVKELKLDGFLSLPIGCSDEYYFIYKVDYEKDAVSLYGIPVGEIREDMPPIPLQK